MPDIILRPAHPGEAPALTHLLVRAKAPHGYDAETMAAFAPALILTETHIARDWVQVACGDPDDAPLGFAHVERRDDPAVAWLEDLFVDPDAQGQGIGTLLWAAVLAHARATGVTELRFDADPHAEAFYARLGATTIGNTPSTLIPGRTTPLMRFVIPPPHDVETATPTTPPGTPAPPPCPGR